MIGLGTIIGGALSLGGAVTNGIAGSKARKREEAIRTQQKRDNQEWYEKNYNEVSTERADAVSALNKMRTVMDERTKNTAGVSAVMGGGNEQVAIEKKANANALGDVVSNIAIQGDYRKDAVEQKYMQTKDSIAYQEMGVEADRANNIASASQNAINTGVGMVGTGLDEYFKTSKDDTKNK